METVFIGSYYAAQSNYIFLGRQLSTCPLAHVPPLLSLPTPLPPHVPKTFVFVVVSKSSVFALLFKWCVAQVVSHVHS